MRPRPIFVWKERDFNPLMNMCDVSEEWFKEGFSKDKHEVQTLDKPMSLLQHFILVEGVSDFD